jgi:1A family penicillin-binding protein
MKPIDSLAGRWKAVRRQASHVARGLFVRLDAIPTRVRGVIAGGVVLVMVVPWVAWTTCGFQGCPDVTRLEGYRPGGAPVLLDRRGDPFAQLHPMQLEVVPLDSLPAHVPAAFLAVEDKRFYRHAGVDGWRALGAAVANLRAGRVAQGASTLTMQLSRTLFPEHLSVSDRTFRRKLLEVRLAGRIEREFEKDEILELYLNHVYMGGSAYGVAAGARHYFGRDATELTPAEAALLAALVRAPAHYDPRRHPERARQRRDLVLGLMEARERGDVEQLRLAAAEEIEVTPDAPGLTGYALAPYFAEVVRRWLEDSLEEELYRTPLRVHTTLDPEVQREAEARLKEQIEAVEAGTWGTITASDQPLQGAVVVLESATGDVVAWVGGRDYSVSTYDRAQRARRQVGSAFKPFVVAAALAEGYVSSQPVADRPLTVTATGAPAWSPRNYDGDFRGPVSVRRALVESLNVPTARLALAVGLDDVARTAQRAGFTDSLPRVPSLALGTTTASPMELAGIYAGLGAGGPRPRPRFVTRVEDPQGRVILAQASEHEPGLDPRVAHLVTRVLQDVVDRGTGTAVRQVGFRGVAAGKTGTTQDAHDVWFAGITPRYSGVVWIGFDTPRPILPGATGGRLAAPVWGRIMTVAHAEDQEPAAWPSAEGIVERTVDRETGRPLGAECRNRAGPTDTELFLEESVPVEYCPVEEGVLDRVVSFFRSLGRGSRDSEAPDAPEADGAQGMDHLNEGASPDALLGAPRLRLARDPR